MIYIVSIGLSLFLFFSSLVYVVSIKRHKKIIKYLIIKYVQKEFGDDNV
jgi:hypothetical protein